MQAVQLGPHWCSTYLLLAPPCIGFLLDVCVCVSSFGSVVLQLCFAFRWWSVRGSATLVFLAFRTPADGSTASLFYRSVFARLGVTPLLPLHRSAGLGFYYLLRCRCFLRGRDPHTFRKLRCCCCSALARHGLRILGLVVLQCLGGETSSTDLRILQIGCLRVQKPHSGHGMQHPPNVSDSHVVKNHTGSDLYVIATAPCPHTGWHAKSCRRTHCRQHAL